jgi:hypothetical protein
MYCTNCVASLGLADIFCRRCTTRVKDPNATSKDVQYISTTSRSASIPSSRPTISSTIPSLRISANHIASSTSFLTNEVRAQKAATTKQDRANSKDILPTSSFGLNPQGKAQQLRTTELFTIEKAIALIKVPSGLRQLKFSPN